MTNTIKIFWKIFVLAWGFFILFVVMVYFGVFGKLPSLAELENPSMLSSSEIYAADGTLMGKYYLKDRTNVKVPGYFQNVVNALIATEDERFYQHSGMDIRSLASAVINLGNKGGASPITQQLAKNLLNQGTENKAKGSLKNSRKWIVAMELERNFTKEEIIALYLNTVSYGDEIYGIGMRQRPISKRNPTV